MNALFLKLLNMSAAGSVLIFAVIVLRALLKRAPRWIICVMWAVVAVRLVCPVIIVSPLSVFQATPSIVSESGEVEVFRPAGGSEKPLLAVQRSPVPPLPLPSVAVILTCRLLCRVTCLVWQLCSYMHRSAPCYCGKRYLSLCGREEISVCVTRWQTPLFSAYSGL